MARHWRNSRSSPVNVLRSRRPGRRRRRPNPERPAPELTSALTRIPPAGFVLAASPSPRGCRPALRLVRAKRRMRSLLFIFDLPDPTRRARSSSRASTCRRRSRPVLLAGPPRPAGGSAGVGMRADFSSSCPPGGGPRTAPCPSRSGLGSSVASAFLSASGAPRRGGRVRGSFTQPEVSLRPRSALGTHRRHAGPGRGALQHRQHGCSARGVPVWSKPANGPT